MLRLAKSGDRDAAIEAIRSAAVALTWRNISPEMSDYLAAALFAALSTDGGPTGDALAKGFGLTRTRKRPVSAATEERSNLIAVWVHLASARGWRVEAKGLASDLWGVENIARAMRSVDEVLAKEKPGDDTWERIFQSMGKPLPPRRQI